MRVALDATPLTLSSGGLRRYTEELSLALAAEYPHDVYTLASDQAFDPLRRGAGNLRCAPLPHTRVERSWWLFGAALAMRRLHVDVFHGTNFEVPYLNSRPSVMTVHDLSPWRYPEWQNRRDRVRVRTPWLLRMGIATMVITPTEAIRKEAVAYFGLSPERVVAVPLGPADLETNTDHPPYGARPYFLFVGTLEPRKNLSVLLEAWRAVGPARRVDLQIAGRRREDGPALQEEPGLRLLGEVGDRQLAGLYKHAIALIYLSHYEGFGLPVLEAMQCGCAVIVSSDPALLEVAGSAALRADSVGELVRVMLALLSQPELGPAQRAQSRHRAADFSWRITANQTHAVYEEAVARFG